MCDFEGAGAFGRGFPGWYLKFEISGLKPDFVPKFPGFEAGEDPFLHALLGEFVGSFSFLPYVPNLVESLLKSVMSTVTSTSDTFMPTYPQGFFQSRTETQNI